MLAKSDQKGAETDCFRIPAMASGRQLSPVGRRADVMDVKFTSPRDHEAAASEPG